jgi:hypothetical protein
MIEPLQEFVGIVEAFSFYGRAGAIHSTRRLAFMPFRIDVPGAANLHVRFAERDRNQIYVKLN